MSDMGRTREERLKKSIAEKKSYGATPKARRKSIASLAVVGLIR